jgi:hypothetical protein
MNKRVFVFHACLIIAVVSSLILPQVAIKTSAQNGERIQLVADTQNLNQDGMLAIFGGLRLGGDAGLPVGAGDINGDGRADVIFCEMFGSAGPGSRTNNGQVNFYISDGRDSGFVDAAQNPPNIFELIGERSGDLLGTSVSANGDVNGDGLRDVAIGASAWDRDAGNRKNNAGAAYVVLGSENFSLNVDLALVDTAPGVIEIYGPQANGRMGIWIDLGDVDGDNLADIIIGSDQIDSAAGSHTGGAYIVFGGPNLPQLIDLAAPPAGVRTARILGAGQEDHWGGALQVGDINNDGIGDVIIGGSIFRDSASYVSPDDDTGHDSRGADVLGRANNGEVAVVYGSSNWPDTVDLSNPPATVTRVIGAETGDLLGSQVHFGDLNGDGRTELIIGALQALAPDNRGRTGAVYVVYGAPNIVGATIDTADPLSSGLYVSSIYGENHLDCGGDSVRSYDINNDGLFELFIGSPEHTLEPEDINGQAEREEAGDTKFIFGRREVLPQLIKLYDPPAGLQVYRLAGGEDDEFSYRLSGGDVDGDGFTDYVANAMHGDGLNNSILNAGEVYVFSGRKISERLGMLPDETTPTPALAQATLLNANSQPIQQAPVGQSGLRIAIRGTSIRTDTEVQINGVAVTSHITNPPGSNPPSLDLVVLLDENPAIRNSAGPLVVRLRNLNPSPSPLSNELTAGRLIGPEITSISRKKKSGGKLILKISGANFPLDGTVEVRANGALIPLKSTTFEATDYVVVKIAGPNAPPSGTTLRVRVVSPQGVASNEGTVVVP